MKQGIGIIVNIKGISLIELMIAVTILSSILALGVRFLTLQHRWAVYEEDAIEAQQQARAALQLMTYELSLLGSGVPEGEFPLLKAKQQEVRFLANLYAATARLTETVRVGERWIAVDYLNHPEKFDRGKIVLICMLEYCEWNRLGKDGGRSHLELRSGLRQSFPNGSTIQVINQVVYALQSMDQGLFKLFRTVDGGTSPVAEGLGSMDLVYFDREGRRTTDITDIERVQIHLTVPMRRTPKGLRTLSSTIWLRNG